MSRESSNNKNDFPRKGMMNMEEKQMMTMEQMKDELKSLYIKMTIIRILTWCAVAVAIFMAITSDPIIALVFLVIALVLRIQTTRVTKSIDEIRQLIEKKSTTEQVEADLNFLRIKVTIYRILTHGFFAAAFISFAVTLNFFIFLGVLIIAVMFGIPTGRVITRRNKTQEYLSVCVIKEVIRDILGDDVEYNPEGSLNPGSVMVPFHYEVSRGRHHIKTVYNGVNIELGNIVLCVDEKDYEEGNRTWVNFCGPWIICDFGKKPACDVYISEGTDKDRKLMKSNVNIDNEQFGSRFCVRANLPQEAYTILTPQMMESISAAADKSGGTVYMSFLMDGKMNIAIQTGNYLFDVGKCYNAEELRRKFSEELRRLTNTIDTLNV
ncbi:MAG: DUF3137 domain-containing protein [Lachnospiraceae bacterium]